MKKLLFFALIALLGFSASAELPARVKEAAKSVNSTPTLRVEFKVNGRPGRMLLGDGGKFALDLGDARVYYDGTTQWAYSVPDKEVSIINPTADELAAGNPAAILSTLGTAFSGVRLKGETYRLMPLSGIPDISEVTVSFPGSGVWPQSMTIVAGAGTLSVADMKFTPGKTKSPLSAFQLKVPKGVTVTDLR